MKTELIQSNGFHHHVVIESPDSAAGRLIIEEIHNAVIACSNTLSICTNYRETFLVEMRGICDEEAGLSVLSDAVQKSDNIAWIFQVENAAAIRRLAASLAGDSVGDRICILVKSVSDREGYERILQAMAECPVNYKALMLDGEIELDPAQFAEGPFNWIITNISDGDDGVGERNERIRNACLSAGLPLLELGAESADPQIRSHPFFPGTYRTGGRTSPLRLRLQKIPSAADDVADEGIVLAAETRLEAFQSRAIRLLEFVDVAAVGDGLIVGHAQRAPQGFEITIFVGGRDRIAEPIPELHGRDARERNLAGHHWQAFSRLGPFAPDVAEHRTQRNLSSSLPRARWSSRRASASSKWKCSERKTLSSFPAGSSASARWSATAIKPSPCHAASVPDFIRKTANISSNGCFFLPPFSRPSATTAAGGKRAFYDEGDPFCESRLPDDSLFTLDHLFTKLLTLEATMQTQSGRIEARQRTEFLRQFLTQLRGEIEFPR